MLNHLVRWWEPFESFAKLDDSVFQVEYWLHFAMAERVSSDQLI